MLFFISIAFGALFLYCAGNQGRQSARARTPAEAAQHMKQARALELVGGILCVAFPLAFVLHAMTTANYGF